MKENINKNNISIYNDKQDIHNNNISILDKNNFNLPEIAVNYPLIKYIKKKELKQNNIKKYNNIQQHKIITKITPLLLLYQWDNISINKIKKLKKIGNEYRIRGQIIDYYPKNEFYSLSDDGKKSLKFKLRIKDLSERSLWIIYKGKDAESFLDIKKKCYSLKNKLKYIKTCLKMLKYQQSIFDVLIISFLSNDSKDILYKSFGTSLKIYYKYKYILKYGEYNNKNKSINHVRWKDNEYFNIDSRNKQNNTK